MATKFGTKWAITRHNMSRAYYIRDIYQILASHKGFWKWSK